MTIDEFWNHIKATKRRDLDEHVERLINRLAKLPPDEILDFEHWWQASSAQAYRWNLWGAAYLINGGCSDDGFMDFRSWLMLQGQKVFDAALANPDSLADLKVEEDEASCECYPATRAWFQATGQDDDYAALDAARNARHPRSQEELTRGAPEPTGENWDFDDEGEMRKRLPRLARMYLDRD